MDSDINEIKKIKKINRNYKTLDQDYNFEQLNSFIYSNRNIVKNLKNNDFE